MVAATSRSNGTAGVDNISRQDVQSNQLSCSERARRFALSIFSAIKDFFLSFGSCCVKHLWNRIFSGRKVEKVVTNASHETIQNPSVAKNKSNFAPVSASSMTQDFQRTIPVTENASYSSQQDNPKMEQETGKKQRHESDVRESDVKEFSQRLQGAAPPELLPPQDRAKEKNSDPAAKDNAIEPLQRSPKKQKKFQIVHSPTDKERPHMPLVFASNSKSPKMITKTRLEFRTRIENDFAIETFIGTKEKLKNQFQGELSVVISYSDYQRQRQETMVPRKKMDDFFRTLRAEYDEQLAFAVTSRIVEFQMTRFTESDYRILKEYLKETVGPNKSSIKDVIREAPRNRYNDNICHYIVDKVYPIYQNTKNLEAAFKEIDNLLYNKKTYIIRLKGKNLEGTEYNEKFVYALMPSTSEKSEWQKVMWSNLWKADRELVEDYISRKIFDLDKPKISDEEIERIGKNLLKQCKIIRKLVQKEIATLQQDKKITDAAIENLLAKEDRIFNHVIHVLREKCGLQDEGLKTLMPDVNHPELRADEKEMADKVFEALDQQYNENYDALLELRLNYPLDAYQYVPVLIAYWVSLRREFTPEEPK